ncbi:unnamed protein product [Sphagnum balticum]
MLINLVEQKLSLEVLEGKVVELEEMGVLPPEKWVSERRCLFSLNQAVSRPSAQLHSKCWKVVSEDIDDLVDAFDACQVLHVQEFGDLDKVVRRHIPLGSGPTTAGKTTISELIKDNFDSSVVHEDDFFNYQRAYKELGGNLEIPEAIDSDRLVEAVKKEIASGHNSLILVEGFQLYHYKALVELLDVRIFLEIND